MISFKEYKTLKTILEQESTIDSSKSIEDLKNYINNVINHYFDELKRNLSVMAYPNQQNLTDRIRKMWWDFRYNKNDPRHPLYGNNADKNTDIGTVRHPEHVLISHQKIMNEFFDKIGKLDEYTASDINSVLDQIKNGLKQSLNAKIDSTIRLLSSPSSEPKKLISQPIEPEIKSSEPRKLEPEPPINEPSTEKLVSTEKPSSEIKPSEPEIEKTSPKTTSAEESKSEYVEGLHYNENEGSIIHHINGHEEKLYLHLVKDEGKYVIMGCKNPDASTCTHDDAHIGSVKNASGHNTPLQSKQIQHRGGYDIDGLPLILLPEDYLLVNLLKNQHPEIYEKVEKEGRIINKDDYAKSSKMEMKIFKIATHLHKNRGLIFKEIKEKLKGFKNVKHWKPDTIDRVIDAMEKGESEDYKKTGILSKKTELEAEKSKNDEEIDDDEIMKREKEIQKKINKINKINKSEEPKKELTDEMVEVIQNFKDKEPELYELLMKNFKDDNIKLFNYIKNHS